MTAMENLSPEYLREYSGHQLTVAAIAFIPLNIIFVAIRFFSRHLTKAPLGLDDILIIPGLILCVTLSILALCIIQYGGVGYHIAAVAATDPKKIVVWSKILFSTPMIYAWAITFPKLSILAMFLRIFTQRYHRITVTVIASILIASAIATTLVSIFECKPVAFFWDKTIPNGRCPVNSTKFYLWASLPNIITDVMMLILPQPSIWKLHTSRSVKLGISFTFFTGTVLTVSGLIASILRFSQFAQTNPFADGTWASVPLERYTIMEPSMYLLASCLPSTRPLFIHIQSSFTTGKLSSMNVLSSTRMRSWKGRSTNTRDSLHSNPVDNTSETELRRLNSTSPEYKSQFSSVKTYTKVLSTTPENNPQTAQRTTTAHSMAPHPDSFLHH
ncbi:integral membrane protein [Rutstroemia sp. NJR-2017a BBW]|nr:integral membrane protein [Rutstroemia sp. NJR-2017a BBW]